MLPAANTDGMNLHLAGNRRTVAPGAHAILTVGGAGWHQTGGRLVMPDNVTRLHLPPYSPELKPVENVWAFLRSNQSIIRSNGLVWTGKDARENNRLERFA